MNQDFQALFQRMKNILVRYEKHLSVVKDKSDNYYLNAGKDTKTNKPVFFGAVQIKKNYVSYHLMPVYCFPELAKSISTDLKKRMQGKSCFNFKKIDEVLFKELANITKSGFKKYEGEGLL